MPFLSRVELNGLKHAIGAARADIVSLQDKARIWRDKTLLADLESATEKLAIAELRVRYMLKTAA
jgi:hypothetical protein